MRDDLVNFLRWVKDLFNESATLIPIVIPMKKHRYLWLTLAIRSIPGVPITGAEREAMIFPTTAISDACPRLL
jgi:hypothetical protein